MAKLRISFLIFVGTCLFASLSYASAPLLRLKTGFSSLSVDAGDLYKQESLNSTVTFQPSILWDFPSFSSRLGIHYLQELNSPHGLTPLSGIGFSAYYHIFGISSSYQLNDNDVLLQKSRPGLYLVASLTPVNLNMNKFDEGASSDQNKYFSAYCNDVAAGIGYDYPLLQNMLLSAEFVYRSGSSSVSSTSSGGSQSVGYSGYTFFITFAAAYY